MEHSVHIEKKSFANGYQYKKINIDGDWVMDVDKIHIKDWLILNRSDEIYDILKDMLKDQPTVIAGDAIDYLVEEYYKDSKIMEYVKEHI